MRYMILFIVLEDFIFIFKPFKVYMYETNLGKSRKNIHFSVKRMNGVKYRPLS